MHQRVKPVEGYYIATYACPVGELGDQFVGYFKVFGKQPRCYCDQDYLFAGNQPVSFAAAADALADGERAAGTALLRLHAARPAPVRTCFTKTPPCP